MYSVFSQVITLFKIKKRTEEMVVRCAPALLNSLSCAHRSRRLCWCHE